jgi:hypothetical protein
MRSPHATTPLIVVNRTPAGFIVVCTCGFTAEYGWRVFADLTAWDHTKSHGTPIREQD